MLRKSILLLLILPLIFTSIYSQNNIESNIIIINSITTLTNTGKITTEGVTFDDAKKWAYNSSLTPLPDSPPVIDNRAFFLTNYQTVIPVNGYKKEKMYTILIDFLKYRESKVPFNSVLKIYIRDIYGKKRQIGTADLSCMSEKKIFEVSVPFDLSYPGRFDIIIQEYSGKTGCWGIWDIIVTSEKIDNIKIIPLDSNKKMEQAEEKIF